MGNSLVRKQPWQCDLLAHRFLRLASHNMHQWKYSHCNLSILSCKSAPLELQLLQHLDNSSLRKQPAQCDPLTRPVRHLEFHSTHRWKNNPRNLSIASCKSSPPRWLPVLMELVLVLMLVLMPVLKELVLAEGRALGPGHATCMYCSTPAAFLAHMIYECKGLDRQH